MKNSQKGQTIIEAIVALVTILLIITAITIVIINGLYNSTFVRNQNEANKYAQQGMELVRNIQQNDLEAFKGFIDAADTFCVSEQDSSLYSENCSPDTVNTGTSYNRTIIFSPGGAECEVVQLDTSSLKVNVTVKWSSSKCPSSDTFCHKSELISCMPYRYPASNP